MEASLLRALLQAAQAIKDTGSNGLGVG
jgi:hypothetical protein